MTFKERIRKWLLSDQPTTQPAPQPSNQMKIPQHIVDMFNTNAINNNLAKWGSLTVIARRIERYIPVPGVIPDANKLAMDHANDPLKLAYDDGQNFFNQNGNWLNQNFCGLGFPGYAYLSELAQRSEYRAPSETTAKEMTRKFIKFISRGKGDKSAKISEIESWFKKHDIRQICLNALTIDLFFGRSQIFIDISGQETDMDRAQPLVIDAATIGKEKLRDSR